MDRGAVGRISDAASLLVLLAAVAVHVRLGIHIWPGNLVGSDETAHFVTGVMVRDYLHHVLDTSPLGFVESFYVRFPRVAIGHWPPAYYGLQGIWYEAFGVSLGSSRWLSALILAALATVV